MKFKSKFRNKIKWFCQVKKWLVEMNTKWRCPIACGGWKEKAITRQKKYKQKEHPKRNHQFEAWTHTNTTATIRAKYVNKEFWHTHTLTAIGRKHRHDERRNKSKQFSFYLYHSVSQFDARTHAHTHNHSSMQTEIEICKWNQKVFNLLEPLHEENCCLLSGGGNGKKNGSSAYTKTWVFLHD